MIGFIFWDPTGEIVDANDYFLELVGYTKEDVQQGKFNWSAITPPENSMRDQKALKQISWSGTCEPFEKGIQLLNKIVNNAQKMKVLIDELLEFSRLGKQELKKTVVDLDKLVAEVVQTVQHKAKLLIQPLGRAIGDYNLLKQVYQNLLINAIKYSSKKEAPEIQIGVQEYRKKKAYYVQDNGAGFNMAYYDKLFGVFQRLHRQDEFEGIGVGLAIVQRIVSKHGGKVWAQGKTNEGATFYFTLATH
jgi:light-regulated signal transduction histidine kinase (bacteriophytochrome)